jgi:hypothetical protein
VVLNTAPALRDHGPDPDPARPGRPLLSLNIWLPAGQIARAEAQLQPLGWARHQGRGGELVPLHTAAGAHLRLISRPFPGPRKPAAHALQLGAVPVTLGGVITPCIGPHDFILYAAYQAAQGEPERQLVRLADIAHALNSELLGADQLIPRARELGVVLAARRVLAALCAQAPSPALRQALAALTAAQPTVRERLREASHIHPTVRQAVQRVRRL